MTVYVPDELAAEVKAELGDANISAICQDALRAELDRVRARAAIGAEGFGRVEVYDGKKERDIAFQGRRIANSFTTDQEAYLTPKGTIVIIDGHDDTVATFDDWDELTAEPDGYVIERWPAEDLMAEIAAALGEKYVEELDI
jgi:hypothetical protein